MQSQITITILKLLTMKKTLFITTLLLSAGAMFTSCNKDVENPDMQAQPEETAQITRAYGDKTPLIEVYYEINDTNPLNALSYEMNSKKFIDLVQLFASNIQKDANGDPCIFFNDKLAPVMAAKATYIEPLQNAGIKVILNVLGDHKGIGISNLTDDQIEKFAAILTYIVKEYDLDGIGFDDEYADYSTPIDPTSASKLVLKLREKFNAEFPGERKIIQMFEWNYASNISAAAGAEIDLADHGLFGPNVFQTSSAFAGVTNDRWCPQAIQMGQSYNAIFLNQIKTRSSQAASGNYGGIMMFNVRKASNVNPLPVFQKIAEGAFGATVTYTGTEYSQDWTFNPAGYTITYADIQ